MNLLVTSVTMVDITNKEAKKIKFSQGKNLLTSAKNHLGKSVIMKSIYYTLGAEVYFPEPIKRLNFLTYVDFILGEKNYRVSRFNRIFSLYCNDKLIGQYSSVGEFGEVLVKIFRFEINLISKDTVGTIVKCPPVFYYLPYYIDQENGWSNNSFSFNCMTQFDMPQRKNSYFFHLGVFDYNYVEISKLIKMNKIKIETLKKENEKLIYVTDTLKARTNEIEFVFDQKSLESAIESRKIQTEKFLNDITKVRNQLIDVESNRIQLEHDKKILRRYITRKDIENCDSSKSIIQCPKCGNTFEYTLTKKLEKIYLKESLQSDYVKLSEEIINLEHKIVNLKNKFEYSQKVLSKHEQGLAQDQEVYDLYLRSKATMELIREYKKQIGDNEIEIVKLGRENDKMTQKFTAYSEKKKKVNDEYMNNLEKLLIELDIPKDQINEVSEPGTYLAASGAYGPRCKIAQILAFVKTKDQYATEVISFPIIIDSPNALEQDKEHLTMVIRTLFYWENTENQIIVASIGGKDTAANIPNVNIILLDNNTNHLLNKEEYDLNEKEISQVIAMF